MMAGKQIQNIYSHLDLKFTDCYCHTGTKIPTEAQKFIAHFIFFNCSFLYASRRDHLLLHFSPGFWLALYH